MTYRLDTTLGFAIHKTAVRLKGELGQRFRPHDVTPEQFAVLSRLWEEDGVPQSELSDRLLKDRPNVTRILDKLERKGLVQRRRDSRDRRSQRIFLTEQGASLQTVLMPIVMDLRADAYTDIPEDEQACVIKVMDRIFSNLRGEAEI